MDNREVDIRWGRPRVRYTNGGETAVLYDIGHYLTHYTFKDYEGNHRLVISVITHDGKIIQRDPSAVQFIYNSGENHLGTTEGLPLTDKMDLPEIY